MGDSWRFLYRARPERVVDGDTIVVVLDLGLEVETRKHLRLQGVWCPERWSTAGEAARDFTAEWLDRERLSVAWPWPLMVETFPAGAGERRSFTRYIAEVWGHDLGSLNEAIIDAGHGTSAP